ncbi:collectin-10 [Ctenopharyngodon idella]|uniref:Putative Colec10 n=1 Tax=Ctenopharyngodon idella TaxID=7959 RepID=A0A3S5HYM7_CTEID|nr:collectin-10 [Ctenopharyngodon idella]AZZ09400.1 putative Colec10 [Ctenopharyngodon idella]
MDVQTFSWKLFLFLFLCNLYLYCTTTEICSNSILPGSKGDPGGVGADGEEGRMGKTGPPGQRGLTGEYGEKGEMGQMGKMGPRGTRGDKGQQGVDGLPGLKGKPGTTCDCGRYRKVVRQMDINISKLRNAVRFLKNVVLGIRETENKFYLLVTEARRYEDSLLNCKLRGGSLAMPRTTETNTLLANYIREADLTHVFIGLQVGVTEVGYMYVDGKPLLNPTVWALQGSHSGKGGCMQLGSTGGWSQVDCGAAQYYICEFVKNKNTSATLVL